MLTEKPIELRVSWRLTDAPRGNHREFHMAVGELGAFNVNVNGVITFLCKKCGSGLLESDEPVGSLARAKKTMFCSNPWCDVEDLLTYREAHFMVSDTGQWLLPFNSAFHAYLEGVLPGPVLEVALEASALADWLTTFMNSLTSDDWLDTTVFFRAMRLLTELINSESQTFNAGLTSNQQF